MNGLRMEINVGKIQQNATILVQRLTNIGISVTGVTKATLGSSIIAQAMIQAGVINIGDSRVENIESLILDGVNSEKCLIRSPLSSQIERVIQTCHSSFNSEIRIIALLSAEAKRMNRMHGIILMIELGDLREGINPEDLENFVSKVLTYPNIVLLGLGTNLACRSGVSPSEENMSSLSHLTDSIESQFSLKLSVVSGGNSANLNWAFNNTKTNRVNNLRLGESILLGREALNREPVDGLHLDAFKIFAEVIESKRKPTSPTGICAQNAYGVPAPVVDQGWIMQTIVAIGHQDTDPDGLTPAANLSILGASSDHMMVNSGSLSLRVGDEVEFNPNYSAMVRAMTSPYVKKIFCNQ